MPLDLDPATLAVAAAAAFLLAVVSAVAGFGGGVVLLPVFTALFGLRVAVPMLTLTQLVSNASRVALNRRSVDRALVGWFAIGAVLLLVVVWRRVRPRPPRLSSHAFIGVGAASGLGSALVGSVGPLTAPFFLARGLVKDAYIGTEATAAVVLHATKLVAYGVGALLTVRVIGLGLVRSCSSSRSGWWRPDCCCSWLADAPYSAFTHPAASSRI